MATHETGTVLTCGHQDCGCRIRIEVPCTCSGSDQPYRCSCGANLAPVEG